AFAFGDPETFARDSRRVEAITASLAPLTPGQRRQAAPERLRLHAVQRGETFAGLARRYPGDERDAAWLSFFNGYDGKPSPRPGDLIKVVTPASG
ncbi:MAG: hypothetical protein PVF51_07360, partial [Nitrospirota bacterium]